MQGYGFVVLIGLFTLRCKGIQGFPSESIKQGQDTLCECETTDPLSTGGFANKFPRYMGTWYNVGSYHELPLYMCVVGCQALSDKMVLNQIHNYSCNNLHIIIIYKSLWYDI